MSKLEPATSPAVPEARGRPKSEGTRYKVEERIATGGMGVVYRVHDRTTGETRALKRMNPDLATRPVLVAAFQREYHVLASLDHPRIIRAYDYDVDDDGPYYTMEYLEGTDIRKVAPLEYRRACKYLRDVATSLALLHARRLIHRDLSASNIRMTADGHVKLIDFGALAPFGTTPIIVGTPPQIPPEALAEAPLDQRADLYALGALAYWLLTRKHAYPARQVPDLPALWTKTPEPPSSLVASIPRELDELVLSLLSADPRARPASAAEVISRLRVIGSLPEEDATAADRLAESFLLSPRFTGRAHELGEIEKLVKAATQGQGGAIRVEAAPGMGRTRLLDEASVRAQLGGCAVVRIDASMHRQPYGAVRALVLRLMDVFPELTRDSLAQFRPALAALGREVEMRLPPRPSPDRDSRATLSSTVEEWFVAFCYEKPLALLVDNVEYADTASLGALAALAALTKKHPLLLIVTERTRVEDQLALGLTTLRSHASGHVLPPFRPAETLELVRSVFSDAPNVERFAEWLHGRAAGSPLYTMEIARQLVAKRVIQYSGGFWILPPDRPDAVLPVALEDALSLRVQSLSADARALAECLSLQDQEPTLDLCRLLVGGSDERRPLMLLDELARNDVLYSERDGYRFSSTAIREAFLGGMDSAGRERNHRRLGEAFEKLGGADDPVWRLVAGWHLIQGADELRGASLIASITHDASTARSRIANLHHMGKELEAALRVYKRHRRSIYERAPILSALAHAGYYEDRVWGDRYGDEALDVLEDLSGLRLARRLGRVFGKFLGLILGLFFTFIRFQLVPRRERPYAFSKVLVDLLGTATALTGAAALSLDVDRARRTADVLAPFSVLPARLTPVGVYQFCRALELIGQEHEPEAYRSFDLLLRRFQDPKYYPALPPDARALYVSGTHFARGSFATFRADNRAALESAAALDAAGNRLYSMIASQLRYLYYMNRGEFEKVGPHREQVEIYAAQVGSAWQVETWEAPALILVQTQLSDVVASTRLARRTAAMSETIPSLRLYSRLASAALSVVSREGVEESRAVVDQLVASRPPRGFIGWAAAHALAARGRNDLGDAERAAGQSGEFWHREAKTYCEKVLSLMKDEDRDYVAMFLTVETELARSEAALGDPKAGFGRLDALLLRFKACTNPLVQGLLHETRARIAFSIGAREEYESSLAEVEKWFRPTGTPGLIAKCERLAELGKGVAA